MKLNLGCGKVLLDDYLNVDVKKFRNVDVVCDCEKTLPFKDDSFDGAYSHMFLEHLDNVVGLMLELARVCKRGSMVHHVVPYCRGDGAFGITHKTFFNEHSMEMFYIEGTESVDAADSKPYKLKSVSMEFRYPLLQWLLYYSRILICGGAVHFKLEVK